MLVLHVSACGASTLLPDGDPPPMFFSQIGHCDDLGLGLKNLVLFTSLPFDDDYVEYMTVYLLTYYIEGRLIYHGYNHGCTAMYCVPVICILSFSVITGELWTAFVLHLLLQQ